MTAEKEVVLTYQLQLLSERGMLARFAFKGGAQPFHGIQFSIHDDSYYDTQDGLSWGVNPAYTHAWNGSGETASVIAGIPGSLDAKTMQPWDVFRYTPEFQRAYKAKFDKLFKP